MKNKIEEKYYFELFTKCYKDFPTGKVVESESPDFIIKSSNKTIGIELSKIFQKSTHRRLNFQTSDSISDDILFQIKELLVYDKLFQFEVQLSLDINRRMTKKERETFANKIFLIIVKNLQRDKLYTKIVNDFEDLDNFPEMVSLILLANVPALKEPHVSTLSRYSLLEENMIELLGDIINKKNQKISLYKENCDEQWLLIHTVDMSSGSFFNPSKKSLEHNYFSSFKKVFFLNSLNAKVYKLNTH